MPQDVWTPMITSDHSLRNKSLRARNKVAHVKLLRGLVPRCAVTVIYRNQQRKKKRAKPKITTTFGKSLFLIKCKKQKIISVLRKKKKSKAKNKNNDDFRNVVIYDETPNALCDSHTSDAKDLAINLAVLAYGNRPNAIKFARANNSDLLRAVKHLIETRL